MNKLTMLFFVAALSGCTSAGHFSKMDMSRYDSNTSYGIKSTPKGFAVQVDYSRYQFVPDGGSVSSACKSQVITIASEHAKAENRMINPISDSDIRISMGRNFLLGMTSCNAYAEAEWK